VERRGGKVYGYHSADGTTWTSLDPIDVSLPAKVRVGVCAGHNTSVAYAPAFEGLQLYRAIVSMPVPPDATPRAGAALLNTGTITISGTTFKSGALTVNGTATLGDLLNTTQIPSGTLTLTGTGVLSSATTLTGAIVNADLAPGFKVGKIKIVGNSHIAEAAIRERLGLTPGKTITAAELKHAEKRLQESRIFKHPPTVTAVDPAGGPVKDIVITIQNQ
jgi:hypothetical protein